MFSSIDWPEPPLRRLAPQEGQTLQRLILGYAYKQIAREIGVGESTVKTYLNRLKAEFGVRSKGEVMVAAIEAQGWLEGRRTPQPIQVSIQITRAGKLEFVRAPLVDPSAPEGARKGD